MSTLSEAQVKFTDAVEAFLQSGDTTFNYNHDYEIDAVPSAIKALRPVAQIVHIDNCFRLSSIHPGIGDLNQLRWLNVSYNQLTEVPVEVARLNRLERLHVNNNKIGFLPLELWALKNLEELRADNNLIRAFPTGVLFLPKLRSVLLENNPLLTPGEADGAEPALLFPPVRVGDCASCCIRFSASATCFVSFHRLAEHASVPVVHYVCSEKCQEQLKLRLKNYDEECAARLEQENSPTRKR